jgi:hypothetical protein
MLVTDTAGSVSQPAVVLVAINGALRPLAGTLLQPTH